MEKNKAITGDIIRDRDAFARILARMVVEGVDPNDAIFKNIKCEFARLDALL